MMKNAFYVTLKAPSFSRYSNSKVSFKIYDVTTWKTKIYNTHISQYLFLFLVFINDLPDGITSICKYFTDDTSLFSKVHDIDISAKKLNSDSEKISKWAFQWKINLDPNKQVNEDIFSRKTSSSSHPLLLSMAMTLINILITSIWTLFQVQN